MTIELTQSVLGWCALLNFGMLLWWVLLFTFAHDWMYRFHGRMFKMPVETFDSIHYAAMAGYKLGIFLLNLVPYLALHIVRSY
jgi:hypothetical protein